MIVRFGPLKNGILTATADQSIWTKVQYENFILDLEFKTDVNTNSGVVIYCTDKGNWIPSSIEIQIADDHHPEWQSYPEYWRCVLFMDIKEQMNNWS